MTNAHKCAFCRWRDQATATQSDDAGCLMIIRQAIHLHFLFVTDGWRGGKHRGSVDAVQFKQRCQSLIIGGRINELYGGGTKRGKHSRLISTYNYGKRQIKSTQTKITIRTGNFFLYKIKELKLLCPGLEHCRNEKFVQQNQEDC